MVTTKKSRTAADERRKLEKDALKQAVTKGHRMSGFATSYGDRVKAFAEAFCLDCSMVMMVNSRPNQKAAKPLRIGGLALLYDCTGRAE